MQNMTSEEGIKKILHLSPLTNCSAFGCHGDRNEANTADVELCQSYKHFQMERKELIGVYIKRIESAESDFFLSEPSIDVYLVDKETESCVKGNSSESNVYSYKSPFTLTDLETGRRSFSDNWNKLLVIDEKFDEIKSENKLLIFEICKKFNLKRRKGQESENRRIAWAFLIPLASDGSTNTDADLKLQLFKVIKDCKISHQDCSIYHLYSDHKFKKLTGFVQILVKGIIPSDTKPTEKSEEVTDKQNNRLSEDKPAEIPIGVKSSPKKWTWSRLPNQSCRIPNKIHKILNLGKNGVSCLQFSRNGLHLAAAVLSKIVIHEVISGVEVIVLNSHFGFIYELDWSLDDQYILSVSNDCRGAVWCLVQKTPVFVLPHPSYVYCGKWFGNEQIVTGGRDHMLRFWCKSGNAFDLVEEIPGHSGFVSALAVQDDSLIISGDSHGCVLIRKYSEGNFTLLKELSFSEISKNVVDSIHLHSSRRRIVVSVRSRGSYLVDVVSGIILQSYKSCFNAFVRRISCLSPCGSLLCSFRQNGDVGVWEVNTGKLVAAFDNLFPFDRVTDLSGCIHYHPHEHMVAVTALGQNYPILMLKYDLSGKKDDAGKLGLSYMDKKSDDYSRY